MVWATMVDADPGRFTTWMAEQGVLLGDPPRLRLVTHLGVSADDVEVVLDAARAFPG